MELAGLLSLPQEILLHVSSYLSVEDVLSCSVTCHYLRTALNHNCVWNKYLPKEDMSQLKLAQQQVQPVLQLDDSHTSLCDSRLSYIKRNHLMNNWKGENFVEHSLDTSLTYRSYMYENLNKVIYSDRYIFMDRLVDDTTVIDVWDVSNIPVLHSSLRLNPKHCDWFCIVGTYLVVIQCLKVSVYQITIPETEFPLVFSFLMTDEAVTFYKHVHHPCDYMSCDGWSQSFAGQYMVSSKHFDPKCTFDVWDIRNAFKVGSFLSPVQGIKCRYTEIHSYLGNVWVLEQLGVYSKHLFKFNIEKRPFLALFLSSDSLAV